MIERFPAAGICSAGNHTAGLRTGRDDDPHFGSRSSSRKQWYFQSSGNLKQGFLADARGFES
ncbi:MAG: hypothetical protein DSY89_10620 [Deltaproteobacteria bacterium]|nr:MAG: hypothetical protein DSY89_10620 [Deltaproteobacteria bacterium]